MEETQQERKEEPKVKKVYPKRNRKEYMQQYYQKHRNPVKCSGCNKEFACNRSLKHHEENNKLCLIRRLEGLFGAMRKSTAEHDHDGEEVEPVIQEEMRRARKLIVRADAPSS